MARKPPGERPPVDDFDPADVHGEIKETLSEEEVESLFARRGLFLRYTFEHTDYPGRRWDIVNFIPVRNPKDTPMLHAVDLDAPRPIPMWLDIADVIGGKIINVKPPDDNRPGQSQRFAQQKK